MKRKLLHILLLSLISIAGVARQPLHYATLQINTIDREFYYYIPSGVSANPALIFVLHGATMHAKGMELATGHQFDYLADEHKNAIIVYPQGYKRRWNTCRISGSGEAKQLDIDDISFIEKMIDFFASQYNINRESVFVMGFSNGAQMCYKLAREKPELFKGFAAVSANLPIKDNDGCYESNQPVSILIMNGTSDPIDPYNGGEMNLPGAAPGSVVSTEQNINYWKSLAKCDSVTGTEYDFPDIDKSDNSTAVEYDYKSTATNKEVVLVKIINGGHNVPNPTFSFWPRYLGNVNKDINAPEIIFDYFMGLK